MQLDIDSHSRRKCPTRGLSLALLLAALGVASCADNKEEEPSKTSDDSDDDNNNDKPDASANEDDELYVLATEIETPEGDVLYLGTVDDLTKPFDLVKRGIEVANASTFQVVAERVFVGLNDAPTITRYSVDKDGELREDETLSFAGVGATSATVYAIANEHKAYLFDFDAHAVHVWDPSRMELTGVEIDLSAARHDERGPIWLAPWRFDHAKRGKYLFVAGGWWHPDDGPVAHSLVLVFDTEADTVKVIEDDRCVNIGSVTQAENGDTYFFYQSYGLVLADIAPCALVIRDGETTLDPDFNLDTSQLFDGRTPWGFVQGPGNTVYAEIPYADRIGSDNLYDTFYSAGNNARFWQLDLVANEAREVDEVGFHAGSRWPFVLGDGRALMPVYSLIDPTDESKGYETEMYEVFEDGKPEPFNFGDESDLVQARLSDIVRIR